MSLCPVSLSPAPRDDETLSQPRRALPAVAPCAHFIQRLSAATIFLLRCPFLNLQHPCPTRQEPITSPTLPRAPRLGRRARVGDLPALLPSLNCSYRPLLPPLSPLLAPGRARARRPTWRKMGIGITRRWAPSRTRLSGTTISQQTPPLSPSR